MGGNSSKEQRAGKEAATAHEAAPAPGPSAPHPSGDESMEVSAPHSLDSIAEAGEGFNGLRVKDKDAWRGSQSPRPRSALKHVSSSVSHDSEASAVTERTPSGRRMPRKVSFQVHGLAPPQEVAAEGSDGGAAEQAHKRIKNSEEFSMKFLVDKFYGKVLKIKEIKPFFDGVDMHKLKYHQEALMLLVFGGQELLDDELPGLSADLRLIHLHLLFEGLNLSHWQIFADTFCETLDELPQIPADVKAHAKAYMRATKQHFRPIEPEEWPPKVVYKGWTKRSCPFHTSYKSIHSEDMNGSAGASSKDGSVKGGAEGQADGAAAAGWAHAAADVDDDAFVLPGFNSPPLPSMTAAAQAEVDRAADAAAAGVEEAKDEVAKAAEAAAST
ncbi:hypothetical protein CHLRE_16g654250v5 [Chlamydomonas reinhardtii]|uniref:Uncharacterized protein n=1 Tax=Chlamydomonas reinhardtii TaxID=3055 RepID=A0A2K3CT24_CHLRE|nr:uncharacterized protein CHLRE_16g654250v5 [Chlamydomonas reinhardtii]PNW71436.1 hypothetical protein CHLRE_16g654250v5 [Chlamydomonas reinhardtii]